MKDIKYFAENYTREEFMNMFVFEPTDNDNFFYFKHNNEIINGSKCCPKELFGTKEFCSYGLCKECIKKSFKDIQFKNDIENANANSYQIHTNDNNLFNNDMVYDYDKEYNILELFAFPNNTKFELGDTLIKVKNNTLYQFISEDNYWDEIDWLYIKENMYGYKLYQDIKQITFADTYKIENKDNLFMVEHEFVKEKQFETLFEYQCIDSLLYELIYNFKTNRFLEIINNGKWSMKVRND